MWDFSELLTEDSDAEGDNDIEGNNDIEKANIQHNFHNSLIDFHEKHSMFGDEKNIFAYSDDQIFYS